MDEFLKCYEKHLRDHLAEDPGYYVDAGVDRVAEIVSYLERGIRSSRFNDRGIPLRRTCRELKIAFTKRAIAAYCGVLFVDPRRKNAS